MNSDPSYNRIPVDRRDEWKTVRTVCRGAHAARQAGFLPTLNAQDRSRENRARNEAYRDRAVFFNATGQTRDGLLGLAFKRDPDHQTVSAKLARLIANVDGAGTSIYQQSQAVVSSVLETGRHGLLVDFSEALGGPVIKSYVAEDVINWRTEKQGGEMRLTLLVLHELAEVDDGYATTLEDRWREYRVRDGAVTVLLWGKTSAGVALLETERELRSTLGPLQAIPFCWVGARNNDEAFDDAPLADLAHVNIAHYRNSADYEDSVFFAGQAQPWISGLTEQWRDHLQASGLYIGSRSPIPLPVNGAFGFAQVQPNLLAREAMDQKETQMAALGAQLIQSSKAPTTATQDENDREASTSVLATVVGNVSDAYAKAFEHCAEFMGQTFSPPAQYLINKDFAKLGTDPQLITAVVSAWQSGAYAKTDARAFLRRMGLLDVDRSDEDIDADLGAEGPTPGELTDDNADPLEGGAEVEHRQ